MGWRGSSFGTVVCVLIMLMYGVLSFMIPMAIAARPSWTQAFTVCTCLRMAILIVAAMYMLARIHTRCTSRKHGSRSLLYVAQNFHGNVELDQVQSHRGFISAIKSVNCGFEFPGIGIVSMDLLAPL